MSSRIIVVKSVVCKRKVLFIERRFQSITVADVYVTRLTRVANWSRKYGVAIKKGRTQTGAPFFSYSFGLLIIILTFTEQLAPRQTFRILG